MTDAPRRTGLPRAGSVPMFLPGLVFGGLALGGLLLAGCSGSLDIDPSTIGGAEPEELVGEDPGAREAPTLTLPELETEDDATVARPDDLDALAVGDAEDPWYLAAGPTPEAVDDAVAGRLAELDREAICAYLDAELDRTARDRLRVPTADASYPPGDPAAAGRLVERAVFDLLVEQIDLRALRVASSLTEACDLRIDLDRARVAARGSLTRALDLEDRSYVDARDDGWATAGDDVDDVRDDAADGADDADDDARQGTSDDAGDADRTAAEGAEGAEDTEDGGVVIDPATGRPFAEAGPRDADVLAAWQQQLAPHAQELCTWASALPVPRDLDTVLARLVQLRTDVAHDGLPSATEALTAMCPALEPLRWSAARSAGTDAGGIDPLLDLDRGRGDRGPDDRGPGDADAG